MSRRQDRAPGGERGWTSVRPADRWPGGLRPHAQDEEGAFGPRSRGPQREAVLRGGGGGETGSSLIQVLGSGVLNIALGSLWLPSGMKETRRASLEWT